jgi:hypothetical protein
VLLFIQTSSGNWHLVELASEPTAASDTASEPTFIPTSTPHPTFTHLIALLPHCTTFHLISYFYKKKFFFILLSGRFAVQTLQNQLICNFSIKKFAYVKKKQYLCIVIKKQV